MHGKAVSMSASLAGPNPTPFAGRDSSFLIDDVHRPLPARYQLTYPIVSGSRVAWPGVENRLRAVGSSPGTVVNVGPKGVADALRILANDGEIDYEGASGSMDWDANGDLLRGHIGIWRFTEDERIEEVRAVAFGD